MIRVMIVDDDHTMVSLLTTLLELDGYDVLNVMRGADVIPRALQARPDIILMDYHLNDTSGVEIVRQIRSHPELAQTPVIIASGMDKSDEAQAAGANDFLVKPFDPGDLPKLFQRHIPR